MRVNVQYFALYRETLKLDCEVFESPTLLAIVDDLRQHLLARGGDYAVLGERNLMCARNEELCSLDEALEDGDHVAFFPAVTGG